MGVPADWREFGNDGGTGPGNFAMEYNQSHAQMVYDIPFGYFAIGAGDIAVDAFDNGASNAVGYILGYSDVDPVGNLYRYLPLEHPYLPGLYASKILSAVPMAHGERDETGNPTGTYSGISGVDPGTRLAIWDFVRTTIYYQTLPYIVMDDTAIKAAPYNGREQFRFTLPRFEGGIRSLNFGKKGQARWAEGEDGPTGLQPLGELITSLQPVKNESYADLVWTWYRVPARGIFQFVNGLPCLPTNIAAVLGKINNAVWPDVGGYPAQTLLCLPPKFHESMYPISPQALELLGNLAGDLPVLYDVDFRFKYYDPLPLDTGATTHGHNLAATRRGTYALWWINQPPNAPQYMYQTASFDQLFELNPQT